MRFNPIELSLKNAKVLHFCMLGSVMFPVDEQRGNKQEKEVRLPSLHLSPANSDALSGRKQLASVLYHDPGSFNINCQVPVLIAASFPSSSSQAQRPIPACSRVLRSICGGVLVITRYLGAFESVLSLMGGKTSTR